MCVCIFVCLCTCVRACVHVCVCVRVYVHMQVSNEGVYQLVAGVCVYVSCVVLRMGRLCARCGVFLSISLSPFVSLLISLSLSVSLCLSLSVYDSVHIHVVTGIRTHAQPRTQSRKHKHEHNFTLTRTHVDHTVAKKAPRVAAPPTPRLLSLSLSRSPSRSLYRPSPLRSVF